jgi:hypothetical protein
LTDGAGEESEDEQGVPWVVGKIKARNEPISMRKSDKKRKDHNSRTIAWRRRSVWGWKKEQATWWRRRVRVEVGEG